MTPPAYLDAAALKAAGIPEGWAFGMADRVRFGELDALNHVNNVEYLKWWEALRVHYVTAYTLSSYSEDDPELVLRDVSARYHKPMFLHEPYILTARTSEFRTTSFTMEYAVFSGDLRATGTAVTVCLNRDGSGRWPLPQAIRDLFATRDGAIAA